MKEFVVEWPELGIIVTAELRQYLNPEICESFWKALPYDSIQSHAVISGEELYSWTPVVTRFSAIKTIELMSEQPPGRVALAHGYQILSIIYGENFEYCSNAGTVPIGQVKDEDIPKLKMVAKEIWNSLYYTKQLFKVTVRRKGE